jgi:hypothetical protein
VKCRSYFRAIYTGVPGLAQTYLQSRPRNPPSLRPGLYGDCWRRQPRPRAEPGCRARVHKLQACFQQHRVAAAAQVALDQPRDAVRGLGQQRGPQEHPNPAPSNGAGAAGTTLPGRFAPPPVSLTGITAFNSSNRL